MASPILINPDLTNAGYLPTGATLTGSLTSLFDGKTLNVDDTDLWQTVDNVQEASGTGETVSALGRVIRAVPCEQTAEKLDLKTDYLTWLSGGIDDTMDEFVLAFAPTTTNQSRVGALNVTEYI